MKTHCITLARVASLVLLPACIEEVPIGRGDAGGPPITLCSSPSDCNDGDECTIDACDPGGTCSNVARDCDDANDCTTDRCDPSAGCEYTALDCDDGNGCTTDACDGSGCTHVPLDCDDADPCTVDSCGGFLGACMYTPIDCDDADPCTSDSCGATGCMHALMCTSTEDDCATARILPGPGTYTSSTVGLADDLTLACGPTGLNDAVFTFTLTAPRDVTVTIPDVADATIELRSACAGGFLDGACRVGSVSRRALPAGTYWIIVELPVDGPFTLVLDITPPTPSPAADTCASAVHVMSGVTPGTTAALSDDYTLSCGVAGRPDAVHYFVVTAASDVTIDVAPAGTISLEAACASFLGDIACDSSIATRLDPGTYFVTVELPAPGPFDLDLGITPL
jgi:hypothetical protein